MSTDGPVGFSFVHVGLIDKHRQASLLVLGAQKEPCSQHILDVHVVLVPESRTLCDYESGRTS